MGFIRAEWHIAVATPSDTGSDPFDTFERAERLDLDPFEQLQELISKEAALCERGVTCPLKDADWDHPQCSVCPERGLAERAELCRVGMAQEKAIKCLSMA